MPEVQTEWGRRIERMFSGIVPWYDALNRLLSLRRDVWWRRALVRGLRLPPGFRVLDLAAGTLDVSLELTRTHSGGCVLAADFSLPMLKQGRVKLAREREGRRIFPVAADAYHLPFGPESFDALTIAFGVRNLSDRAAGLREMRRVLKTGGTLAVLEFVPPESGLRLRFYHLYLHRLLPRVGNLFSRHAFAYSYLAQSIANFPSVPEFCGEMAAAGFREVTALPLTGGIAYVFAGRKSGAAPQAGEKGLSGRGPRAGGK